MTTEYWEQWVGSTTPPHEITKAGAAMTERDGRRWITYNDTIRGRDVTVEMPHDAPTRTCDRGRHDRCPHGLGRPQEGGVLFVLRRHRSFHWRCGCPCHNKPMDIGRLF